jgi:hypothetical protein
MTPAAAPPSVVDNAPHERSSSLKTFAIVCFIYALITFVIRFAPAFHPWSYDPDQRQAVFQYWRYFVSGAFPPGDMLTDYAFVMHAPPLWWLLMATLSTLMGPLWAAKLLNVFVYLATPAVLWRMVKRLSNEWLAWASVVLLLRAAPFHGITAGGYARSFGPLLVLVFLDLWLQRKHTWVLVVLVVQAALYPSVVIPCGIAYGVYVVVKGPMRVRLRQCAGMFVAGLLVLAFGFMQDLRAPSWWGSIVTKAQAEAMPAWGRNGRVNEVPLHPIGEETLRYAGALFIQSGDSVLSVVEQLTRPARVGKQYVRDAAFDQGGKKALLAVTAVLFVVVLVRRRRDLPMPLWALPVAAFAGYILARIVFFKLYLPYRSLGHTWPYVLAVAWPVLVWLVVDSMKWPWVATRKIVIAVTCTLAPVLLVGGHGFSIARNAYNVDTPNIPLWQFARTLPRTSTFAGELSQLDALPLMGQVRVTVNRVLAHPFRPGFYSEIERRIHAMYAGLYAADLHDVVEYAHKEHITHIVVSDRFFRAVDAHLWAPVDADARKLFTEGQQHGFALLHVPQSAVVFSDVATGRRVLDVDKLLDGGAPADALPSGKAQSDDDAEDP